jgi:hypothetical protein
MAQDHPEVVIDRRTYPVQRAVEDEIVNLRRGTTHEILDRIKLLTPEPGDTVVVCIPSNVSSEFGQQVGALAKQHFPEQRIAIVPEGLEFHTQEGLGELLAASHRLASAVREKAPKEEVDSAANALNDMLMAKYPLSERGEWTLVANETENGYMTTVEGDPLPEGARVRVREAPPA